jgi:hypothetical protein
MQRTSKCAERAKHNPARDSIDTIDRYEYRGGDDNRPQPCYGFGKLNRATFSASTLIAHARSLWRLPKEFPTIQILSVLPHPAKPLTNDFFVEFGRAYCYIRRRPLLQATRPKSLSAEPLTKFAPLRILYCGGRLWRHSRTIFAGRCSITCLKHSRFTAPMPAQASARTRILY